MYKILIVEDEVNARQGLLTILKSSSFSLALETAENGQTGFEKAISWQPDMIITDIKMPLCNGLDMIKKIRNAGLYTRYIILTGFAEFQYAQTALQYGVTDYILKPIVPEQLFTLLQKCIRDTNHEQIQRSSLSMNRHILLNTKDELNLKNYCHSQKYSACLVAVIYRDFHLPLPDTLNRFLQQSHAFHQILLPDSRFYGALIFSEDYSCTNIINALKSNLEQYLDCTAIYNILDFSKQYPTIQNYQQLCDNLKWSMSIGNHFISLKDVEFIQQQSSKIQLPSFYYQDLKKLLISQQFQSCAKHIHTFLLTLQGENLPP